MTVVLTPEHRQPIFAIDQLSDSELITGSLDRTVRIWDLQSKCLRTYKEEAPVFSLLKSKNGAFFTGLSDGKVNRWDIRKDCLEIRSFKWHSAAVTALSRLPGGKLASVSKDQIVNIIDEEHHKLVNTFNGHKDEIWSVVSLPHQCIATGGKDRSIRIWGLRSNRCVAELTGPATTLAIMGDGCLISSDWKNKSIYVWDLSMLRILDSLEGHNDGVTALAAQGNWLVSCSWDKTVKLWNLSQPGANQQVFKHKEGARTALILSGGQIASGGYDGVFHLSSSLVKKQPKQWKAVRILTLGEGVEAIGKGERDGPFLKVWSRNCVSEWNIRDGKNVSCSPRIEQCVWIDNHDTERERLDLRQQKGTEKLPAPPEAVPQRLKAIWEKEEGRTSFKSVFDDQTGLIGCSYLLWDGVMITGKALAKRLDGDPVSIWDVSSQKKLEGLKAPVPVIGFKQFPGGIVVSASANGTIITWSQSGGDAQKVNASQLIQSVIQGGWKEIARLRGDKSGAILMVLPKNRLCCLHSFYTWNLDAISTQERDALYQLNANGSLKDIRPSSVILGKGDTVVKVLSDEGERVIQCGVGVCAAITLNKAHLVTITRGQPQIRIWDLVQKKVVKSFTTCSLEGRQVKYAKLGEGKYALGLGPYLEIWDFNLPKRLLRKKVMQEQREGWYGSIETGHYPSIGGIVALSPKRVALADDRHHHFDKYISVWNVEDGRCEEIFLLRSPGSVSDLVLLPNGRLLVKSSLPKSAHRQKKSHYKSYDFITLVGRRGS